MKKKSIISSVFLTLIALFMLATCQSSSKATQGKGDITSLEWRLISVKSTDLSSDLKPVSGHLPTLRVADGKANGSTGCNTYNGPITVDGYTIKFGRLVTTRKFCTEGAALENSVLNMLGMVDNYTVVKGDLHLKKGSNVLAVFSSYR